MSIAYKEARETRYWLKLLRDCGIIETKIASSFLKDIEELIKISGSIIKTVKRKNTKSITPNSRLLTSNSRLKCPSTNTSTTPS